MGIHPDKTARRAVDACGGVFPTARNDYDAGWQRGHEAALDAAMYAVAPVDALTADLFTALSEARTTLSIVRTQIMVEIGRCADPSESRWEGVPEKLKEKLAEIDAAIAKTAGQ